MSLGVIHFRRRCLVFGYIRNATNLWIPDDIGNICLLFYHADEYFASFGDFMSADLTGKQLKMSRKYATYNTAFGSVTIDATMMKNYEWKFQVINTFRSVWYSGGIGIGIVCFDNMSPKLLQFYHKTYFYGYTQLRNYGIRSNGTKISKDCGYEYPYHDNNSYQYKQSDYITMSLNITSNLDGILSFGINSKPKQEAFKFHLGYSKYKMAVSLYRASAVRLVQYTEDWRQRSQCTYCKGLDIGKFNKNDGLFYCEMCWKKSDPHTCEGMVGVMDIKRPIPIMDDVYYISDDEEGF